MRRNRLVLKGEGLTRLNIRLIAIILAAALILSTVTLNLLGIIHLNFLGKAFGAVVTPIQSAFTTVADKVKSRLDRMAFQRELEKEYANLSALYEEQKTELVRQKELENQVKRLTKLLGYQQTITDFKTVYASVIAMDPGNAFATFTIDRGSRHGIQLNDTVITPDGLVGRIYEVSEFHSVVVSIIDSRSSVGGICERTRDVGMVHGNLNMDQTGDQLRMLYLPSDIDLSTGDRIVSSGLEKIFPKGILIGTVQSVSRDGEYVTLTPAVDFQHLEEVLVITNYQNAFNMKSDDSK